MLPNIYFALWTLFLIFILTATISVSIPLLNYSNIFRISFYGFIIYGRIQYSSTFTSVHFTLIRDYELKILTELINNHINYK